MTAAGFADKGHHVTCVDADAAKVAQIGRGVPPFYEPGLAELLRHNSARLEATADLARGVFASDVSFIAVGTPLADGLIDLAAVRTAARQVGSVLRDRSTYHVVVVRGSTASSVCAPTLALPK